jgi:hypothetical protein
MKFLIEVSVEKDKINEEDKSINEFIYKDLKDSIENTSPHIKVVKVVPHVVSLN